MLLREADWGSFWEKVRHMATVHKALPFFTWFLAKKEPCQEQRRQFSSLTFKFLKAQKTDHQHIKLQRNEVPNLEFK